MKIDFMNNTYIVYLNKYNIINFDFNNTKILEDNIRNLLIRLKKYYKLDIKGCYNIVIYIDESYGVILEVSEDDNYYDYFSDTVSLRMKKIKTSFKYEVEDISDFTTDKFKIIINNRKMYLEIIDSLCEDEYLRLLEMSKIVYDK